MKKFRYTIIAALALFVLSCSMGGGDDDEAPPSNTPPPATSATVGGTASGSVTLPSSLTAGTTTAAVTLDPANGFTLTVAFELSGDGNTYTLHLTVSGKEYLLSRVSGGDVNPLAAAWKLPGDSNDDFELTFEPTGDYTLSYTLAQIPIASAAQLQEIGADYPLNGNYELTADITLTNWTPIGSGSAPFTGTFDGKAKTITLKGFAALDGNLGVFGNARNAEIRDFTVDLDWSGTFTLSGTDAQYAGGAVGYAEAVTLRDITVSGSGLKISKALANVSAGGIAGICVSGTTSGCHSGVDVDVYSADGQANAGGIVGQNTEGLITLCSATGDVKAESSRASSDGGSEGRAHAGGIAGSNAGSTISKSYAGGAVTAGATGYNSHARVGGIAGLNAADIGTGFPVRSAALITDCYSTGDVTATEGKYEARAGGIAGQNVSNQSVRAATVRRCYSTGNISASGSGQAVRAGGIIGLNQGYTSPSGEAGSVIVEYCYAAGDISAGGTASFIDVGGIVGLNSGPNGRVRYSAALNRQITNWAGGTVLRIGQTDQASLNGNFAWSGIKLNSATVGSGDQDSYSGRNGQSTTTADLTGHAVWEYIFDSSNFGNGKAWEWVGGGYPYPALQWQTSVPSVPTLEP